MESSVRGSVQFISDAGAPRALDPIRFESLGLNVLVDASHPKPILAAVFPKMGHETQSEMSTSFEREFDGLPEVLARLI